MKRRDLVLGSAVILAGCGGGGSGPDGTIVAAQLVQQTHVKQRPAPTPAPTPAPISSSTTIGRPFGSRLTPYPYGTKPSVPTSQMDATLTAGYDAWKAARIVKADAVVSGGFADQFSDTNYLCVSEGMGYAMLLAVLFAGHDQNAQQLFDGLLSVVRTRYAYSIVPYEPLGKYLMDWRVPASGGAGDGWSAGDGDLDIAMALLMADTQWGSAGVWNYKQEALNSIAALKAWNFDKTTGAVGGRGVATPGASRTSDYMLGHFRAFKAATNDTFWDLVISKAQYNLDYLQTNFAPTTGLLPDWAQHGNTSTPSPSPGFIGDYSPDEMHYWWNACRDPWRLGTDYVVSGDTSTQKILNRLVSFFQSQVSNAGGDVTVIGCGYSLDGTKLAGGNDAAYMAPIMLGAQVDGSYQTLIDKLWAWNASRLVTGYYDSEIQLLSMVTSSGNWWVPTAQPVPIATPTPTQPPACVPYPDWNGTTRYMSGDKVTRLGKYYIALPVSNTVWNVNSPPEWTPTYWALTTCP